MLATIAGTVLTVLATLYALAALLCRPRTWQPPPVPPAPMPVTVLKPLCGAEARLAQNLETLCVQTHPCYQIVWSRP
jgi:ceramide glucosyltransferase